MKKLILSALILILTVPAYCYDNFDRKESSTDNNSSFVAAQESLEGNNIRAWIWDTGIFNQDLRSTNTPGFEWPKNSGKFAVFTTGLTIAGYVNNGLRMAAGSYKGEYRPGYCINGQFFTDERFRFYKVSHSDNYISNPDWLNWGNLVPFGAPYTDANHNGTYEYYADTPGVKGAAQTVFVCFTDSDPATHSSSEGFSGGTLPVGAEVHMTSWCYDNPGYENVQFIKWSIINKNNISWTNTYYSFFCDADLGDFGDDYIGCDSTRNLQYCYNADDTDGNGSGRTYGLHPPAVGMMFLNCIDPNSYISSFNYFGKSGFAELICMREPQVPAESFNYMKGLKRDGTPFVIPGTNPPLTTKFVYSGDPETDAGWTENKGRIDNCDGSLSGNEITHNPAGDRRYLMSIHNINQTMNPGDTQVIQMAQLIARGTNNLNSVTKLKLLGDAVHQLCQNGFVIGINPISTEIPAKFNLYQNYPNPFNPTTQIKFEIPLTKGGNRGLSTKLIIYNAIGQQIATLVDEQLKPGTYSIDWNASNQPSGIYFYKLVVGENTSNGVFAETKKMVLLK